jgi:acyl-CoA dehydrogenase
MLDIDPALLGDTAERAALRGVLREFLTGMSAPEEVRRHMASARGYDEAVWRRLATEIGVPGLVIPEEYGGSGFAFTEVAVALEEAGRALLCAPLLPTLLASYALLLGGEPAICARYLPDIAAGTRTATVVGLDGGPTVRSTVDGWAGYGTADGVLDGYAADLLLVLAPVAGTTGLFVAAEEGLTRTPQQVLDGTRRQARVALDGTPLTPAGRLCLDDLLDIGRAALAAEQVGGAGHALDATVSYVGQRHQFGRPIGSFQAVKHRLADLLVELEAARSAAAYATACVTARSPDLALAASAARVVCSATYRLATAEYVQLHGGTGFTWEHPAHLYLRRAHGAEVLFGAPDEHRARVAGLIGV